MPWKQGVSEMEQREAFIKSVLKGKSSIAELCEEFGISRTVGHKLIRRFEQEGKKGLEPKSRRPKSCSHETSEEILCAIIHYRTMHPRWGSEKLRVLLTEEYGEDEVPSERTITRILDKSGLIEFRRRKHRLRHISSGILIPATEPNKVWTADIKGWWRTRDGKVVHPLTIRDEFSKYILDIGALSNGDFPSVRERFIKCFKQYGMPMYIRTDNGAPFAAIRAVQGLSRLSVEWLRRGIMPERILPASPYMNGAHERMHKDIKAELQCKPLKNIKDEQKRFDEWREQFNTIRPHQALQNKRPNQIYRYSSRIFQLRCPEYQYPQDMETRRVGHRGTLFWHSKEHFISNSLACQTLGIRQEDCKKVSVWFCELRLGETDENFMLPLGGA